MGKAKYKNGDRYKGEFKDGRQSGKGKFVYKNLKTQSGDKMNATYEGSWKAGKRHGKGIMQWGDGSEFHGDWINDNRVKGRMIMVDGTEYVGTFKDDYFHGRGKIYLPDGKIFEGECFEGVCMQIGTIYYQNGDIYTG